MSGPNLALTVLLIGLAGVSPAQPPGGLNRTDLDRAHAMLHDAREELKKHYYDSKFHGLDLDARYKESDAGIAHANSIGQAFSIVAAFLDGLDDSHTFFNPPSRAYRIDYGFRVEMFGDKPLIARVRPGTEAESKLKPGDEVLAWNGLKIKRNTLWKINYLYNNLAPQKSSILSLRDPSGQIREAVVAPYVHQLKRRLDLTETNGDMDLWQLVREEESSDHAVRQRWVETEGARAQ